MLRLLRRFCLLAAAVAAIGKAARTDVWQPFIEGEKWGFIDAHGAWKIPARFDHLFESFIGKTVRASEAGKLGLLARDGHWLIAPRCSDLFATVTPFG